MGSPSCMAVAGGMDATQGDARRVTDMSNVPNNTHCDVKKKIKIKNKQLKWSGFPTAAH